MIVGRIPPPRHSPDASAGSLMGKQLLLGTKGTKRTPRPSLHTDASSALDDTPSLILSVIGRRTSQHQPNIPYVPYTQHSPLNNLETPGVHHNHVLASPYDTENLRLPRLAPS